MTHEVPQNCHHSLEGGHQGVVQTNQRVRRDHYWHGRYAGVERHVKSCRGCSSSKSRPYPRRYSPGNVLVKRLRNGYRIGHDPGRYLVRGWDPGSTLEAVMPVGSTKMKNRDPRRWRYQVQKYYRQARSKVNERLRSAIQLSSRTLQSCCWVRRRVHWTRRASGLYRHIWIGWWRGRTARRS